MKSTKKIFVVAIAALMLFAFTACNNTPSGAVTHVVATQTAVYVEGEKPASDGFTYTGYTNIGATVTVDPADITLIQDGSSNNYAIWCRGVDAGEIEVKFEALDGITVDVTEAVTKYYKSVTGGDYGDGRELDTTGVVVTAEYAGGEKIVDNDCVTFDDSAIVWDTAADYTVTVKLGTAEDTYEVSVVDNLVKAVVAKTTDKYVVYYTGTKPSGNPAVSSTSGIYIEKEYEGGEKIADTSSIQYQVPATGAFEATFPTKLIPEAAGSSLITLKYTGTDGIVGLNRVSNVSVTWVENKVVSVELVATPASVSKATGFSATGFTFASEMTDGKAGSPAPTAKWWDGEEPAPGEDENYITIDADLSTDSYVVGDRYSFTVTGRVEGFPINETFEAVVTN